MGEIPEPTAKRRTESTSSSTPSILKPGPMTWLISSARPALASVSQPVPGDHSDEVRARARVRVGVRVWVRARARARARARVSVRAVSYTHLTLPTTD